MQLSNIFDKLFKPNIFDNSDYCYLENIKQNGNNLYTKKLHKKLSSLPQNLLHHLIWQSKITRIYLIVLIVFFSFSLSHSECHFPEHWWGNWFQKGVPDLIYISKFNISEKGICKKTRDEKYIIENRSDRCIRCLVISERHPNILQYKETNICYPIRNTRSYFEICSQINGDAPLYSLFRVDTAPIKCPFKGPYTFSYSKGINECKDPLSRIDQCTDDKHLLLKFKACADVPGSESKVEELECIADWKEGSFKYLVGKLHYNLATSDEDKFRCFVIEKNNTDNVENYNIGQSGDASCDGLFSPRDGLRTFKIRKTSEIKPTCNFPDWLVENRHWKTLDNRQIYNFSAEKIFTVMNDKKDVFRNSKCIEYDPFLNEFNSTRFVIHTTLGCKSGFACMLAHLREERIVELQIGNIFSDKYDACLKHNFNPSTTKYITLTTFDDETRACSLKGTFYIKSKIPYSDKYGHNTKLLNSNYSRLVSFLDSRFTCPDKSLRLKSNCEDRDQFQFICSLDNRIKNFKCRGGWQENNIQYFLVSFIEKFNYEYCISFNIETSEIKLIRNSHFCYRENNTIETNGNSFYDITSKFHPLNDDLVSFTLINDGLCSQRSGVFALRSQTDYCIIQFFLLSALIWNCIYLLNL